MLSDFQRRHLLCQNYYRYQISDFLVWFLQNIFTFFLNPVERSVCNLLDLFHTPHATHLLYFHIYNGFLFFLFSWISILCFPISQTPAVQQGVCGTKVSYLHICLFVAKTLICIKFISILTSWGNKRPCIRRRSVPCCCVMNKLLIVRIFPTFKLLCKAKHFCVNFDKVQYKQI